LTLSHALSLNVWGVPPPTENGAEGTLLQEGGECVKHWLLLVPPLVSTLLPELPPFLGFGSSFGLFSFLLIQNILELT
jgi:hypothetical protein